YFVAVNIFPTKIELEHIYRSWYITFVGIGVIPNTSQLFIYELGKIVFWVALFFYLLLIPILIKRITKSKEMPESTIPLLT
ncbi:C4-dicarboxylate ABC transporter, partial [Enterococcus faecalis]